jgi:hypothetical protein
MFARTEQEYDQTHFYEALKIAFGNTCPMLNPNNAYRFFENTIKRQISHGKKETEWTFDSVRREGLDKAVGIEFCGRRVTFTSLHGNDTEEITLDNPHGTVVMSGISVK